MVDAGSGGSGNGSGERPGEGDRDRIRRERLDGLERRIEAARARGAGAPGSGAPGSAGAEEHYGQAQVAWRMVIELVAGIAIGFGMGYGVDLLLGTTPVFLVAMTLLGFAAGVRTMLRTAKEVQDAQADAAGAGPPEARNGDDGAGPDDGRRGKGERGSGDGG